jgi:glycine/D-amino acid oxidase-like deaminating enzyme
MNTITDHPPSFWEREAFLSDIDFLIIGAGIVGLNAALFLRKQRPHDRIVVLERSGLPMGASTRNAGFACFGSMTELLDDLSQQDADEVWGLVSRRFKGLEVLRKTVGDKQLGYRACGGYELFTKDQEDLYQQCIEQMPYFNQEMFGVTQEKETFQLADHLIPSLGLRDVAHLVINNGEGHLHPGYMVQTLLRLATQQQIEIRTGIEVRNLEAKPDGVRLEINRGWTMEADRVLVATNGFAHRLLPDLPIKPARNQVLITKPIPGLTLRGTFHYDQGYVYFRDVGDRLLLGGARNMAAEEESTDVFGTTKLIQESLLTFARRHLLPDHDRIPVEHWWSGILGVGDTKKPILKLVDDRLAVAVRLGGMGVALGSLLGQEGGQLLMDC